MVLQVLSMEPIPRFGFRALSGTLKTRTRPGVAGFLLPFLLPKVTSDRANLLDVVHLWELARPALVGTAPSLK